MNGRQNKGTGRILLFVPENVPQKTETVQQLRRRLRMSSDRLQNIDLAVLNSRSVKIFAVSHVEDYTGDRLITLFFFHVREVRPGRFYIPDDHGLQLRVPKSRVKDRNLHPPAQIADQGSFLLVQIHL